jgi:hypothetical protein
LSLSYFSGRRKREEGRRKKEEGRRKREEAIKSIISAINNVLIVEFSINITKIYYLKSDIK